MHRTANSTWALFLILGACSHPASTTTTASNSTLPATPSQTTVNSAAPSESADMASAPIPDDKGRAEDELRDEHRHHHGGVVAFVSMSIDALGLPPEKKAQLEKIQADLRAKTAPVRDAERNVMTVMADGMAAGSIDKKKVATAVTKFEATAASIHPACQDALNQVHAALSPGERMALVEKVRAHAEIWKQLNADEEVGSREKESHLAYLTDRVSLTPEQVDKIVAALKTNAPKKSDSSTMDAHIQAFATAFAADTFDAKSLAVTSNTANAYMMKQGVERMTRFYEIVTPLLTADQRTKVADLLRDHMKDRAAVAELTGSAL